MAGHDGLLKIIRLLLVVAIVGALPTTGGWITVYVLGGLAVLAGFGCCVTSWLCGDCDCDCSGCTCADCGCGDCDCDPGCGDCDCDPGCGDCCECDCGECLEMAPDDGTGVLSAAPLLLPLGRSLPARALSHHPATQAYEQDTYNLRGLRLCIGCFTTYPLFLAVSAWLAVAPPGGAWSAWLGAGLAMAALQAVSAAGLARLRWQKVVIKACLGAGLAAAVHGVLASPWPVLGQQAALLGLLALAMLSAVPRALRMRAAPCDLGSRRA